MAFTGNLLRKMEALKYSNGWSYNKKTPVRIVLSQTQAEDQSFLMDNSSPQDVRCNLGNHCHHDWCISVSTRKASGRIRQWLAITIQKII